MSRHRNVRGYNYDEDFEDDDVYGQSVEDDYCISPSTAAQFIYSRRDKPSAFAEPLEEEYGYEGADGCFTSGHQLTEVDRARLNSCLDQMREVLAESIPEQTMVQAVLDSKFDVQKALDLVLSQGSKQNVKTKHEDAVIVGKMTKGDLLFCPEMSIDAESFSCGVENVADNTSKPGFGNLTAKSDSASCSLITSDKMLPNAEKCNIPSSERKGLESSSPALSSSFSDDLCKGSFCEPLNKQVENQLLDSANAVSFIPDNEDVSFSIGSNPSGNSSFKKLESKETQDLKSLLMQNVVCDSQSPEDRVPLVSSNTSACNSDANFYSPPCSTSALGKLALDNEVSHTVNRNNELLENFSSLVQSGKQESPSSDMGALPVLWSGSTSLADLLQEHQESSASHCYSLSDLYNQSTASLTDRNLGTTPLSQLVSQASGGMPELTGSLSSLALSQVSPPREVENLSLSDLIAETMETDKTQQRMDLPVVNVAELSPSKGTNIDLSVLVKNAGVSEEQNVVGHSNIVSSETKLFKEKQGKCSAFAQTNKKPKRGLTAKRQDLSLSWMRTLRARPSAFALTLCLRYPPKGYKRHAVGVHKAFLYSRQVQDVKPKETSPIIAITPFDFKSASPDDIVKANKKKPFTRQ